VLTRGTLGAVSRATSDVHAPTAASECAWPCAVQTSRRSDRVRRLVKIRTVQDGKSAVSDQSMVRELSTAHRQIRARTGAGEHVSVRSRADQVAASWRIIQPWRQGGWDALRARSGACDLRGAVGAVRLWCSLGSSRRHVLTAGQARRRGTASELGRGRVRRPGRLVSGVGLLRDFRPTTGGIPDDPATTCPVRPNLGHRGSVRPTRRSVGRRRCVGCGCSDLAREDPTKHGCGRTASPSHNLDCRGVPGRSPGRPGRYLAPAPSDPAGNRLPWTLRVRRGRSCHAQWRPAPPIDVSAHRHDRARAAPGAITG
jgi:hypothetical protein